MGRNNEWYNDPTATEAINNVSKEEHKHEVERLAVIGGITVIMMKIAELAGFEIVGRIVFKDKKTGKLYK